VFSPIENAAADIERAIESFAHIPDGGLILPPDTTTIVHRDLIIALAARHKLPAVYPDRHFVAAGGLMCYSTDRADQYRTAASYVDRILRGTMPADLPVQVPTKYETVVNLKTANSLGLDEQRDRDQEGDGETSKPAACYTPSERRWHRLARW